MRVHELILSRAVLTGHEPGRLLVRDGADEFVTNPILSERMTIVTEADEAPRGNDIVLALVADPLSIGEALAEVPEGVHAALILTVPIEDLPVGALIDAVISAGAQVRDFAPVQNPHATCVLIAIRSTALVAPTAYLRPGSAPTELDDRALKRLIAEWVVDGAVTRAQINTYLARAERAQQEVAELRAQLDAARVDNKRALDDLEQRLERGRKRIDMLESSEALRLGGALIEMRRHPLRGSATLTRELRAAFARKRSAEH